MSTTAEDSGVSGLRVTCLIGTLNPGGAERVLVRVAEWLAEQGAQVEIVTLDVPGPNDLVPGAGVSRRSVRRSPGGALLRRLALLRALRRALLAQRPHVVLSFLTETNVAAVAVLLGTGTPIVVSERVDFRQHPTSIVIRGLRELCYRRTSGVVVQTAELADWVGVHRRSWRVAVIPNPVLPTPHAPPPQCVRPGGRVLLGMGRLEPQKGFDTLVRAFAVLADDHPDWQLVLAGEGPMRGELERLRAAHGLEDRIVLPGRVDPPWGLLRRADLFVLPSRYEGFPNALAEAMAAGVTSVATDCPTGPRDLVRPDVDGVLVPVDDPPALARALGRLMADEGLRERLAERAPEVMVRFSPGSVLPRWGEVLAQCARPRVPAE